MNVFYAHPASSPPKQLKAEVRLLAHVMRARTRVESLSVRAGRDDHQNHWKGNWDDWQYSIVHRMNMTTGKPVYGLFVVTGTHCGRATANILRLALSVGRPVFWWNGQEPGKIYRVLKIEEDDEEDWAAGWRIVYDQPKKKSKGEQLPLPFTKVPRP